MVRRALGGVFVLAAWLLSPGAVAEPMLDWTADADGRGRAVQADGTTLGWRFDVVSRIIVESLGVFDDGPDGLVNTLANEHKISIWRCISAATCGYLTGRDPLVMAVVGPGSPTVKPSTSAAGDWVFQPVEPFVLMPGRYVIGADYEANDADLAFGVQATVATMAGTSVRGVDNSALDGSGLGFSALENPESVFAWFGPNLETSSIGEPGSLAVAGAGLLFGVWLRRRARPSRKETAFREQEPPSRRSRRARTHGARSA